MTNSDNENRGYSLTVYSDLLLDGERPKTIKSQNLLLDSFRIKEQNGTLINCDPENPDDRGLLYTANGTFQNQNGKWVKIVLAARKEAMVEMRSKKK